MPSLMSAESRLAERAVLSGEPLASVSNCDRSESSDGQRCRIDSEAAFACDTVTGLLSLELRRSFATLVTSDGQRPLIARSADSTDCT